MLAGLAIMALGVAQFIDRDKAVEIGLIIAILSMINLLLGVIGLGTVLALIGGLMPTVPAEKHLSDRIT